MGADRIKETATVTGTGDITLTGNFTGYLAFSTAYTNGQTLTYVVYNTTDDSWEIGVGTYNTGTNSITRTTWKVSSTGSKVSFGAGTKYCFNTIGSFEFSSIGGTGLVPVGIAGNKLDHSWLPALIVADITTALGYKPAVDILGYTYFGGA